MQGPVIPGCSMLKMVGVFAAQKIVHAPQYALGPRLGVAPAAAHRLLGANSSWLHQHHKQPRFVQLSSLYDPASTATKKNYKGEEERGQDAGSRRA